MMRIKKLIILTIICNLCIVVAIGHGAGPLFIVMPMLMQSLAESNFDLHFAGSYEQRLPTAALFSVIGNSILIAACLFKQVPRGYFIAGLATLLFALCLMSIDVSRGEFDGFVLIMAIPFLYAAIRSVLFLEKTFSKAGKSSSIE